MNKALLDTDILSAIIRQNPSALSASQDYLAVHQKLSVSIVTRYEVLRGLHAKQAKIQIDNFNVLCGVIEIFPITDDVVVKAAEIYGELHRAGQLIGDADTLIAATCLVNGYDCVTNNTNHMQRVNGLSVINWLTK
jgi:tRNA(fMet)-specific endonuclease VapC